jgi:formylglycine-generating enzyme required for sulfatase activity
MRGGQKDGGHRPPIAVRNLRNRPLPEGKKKWPKEECREIPTFVLCEPEEFMMGAVEGDPRAARIELPSHAVRLSAYWLQSTPVTIAQYRLFDPDHDCPGSDDCPVTRVTWYDAWAFSLWIGGMLPTEAQWECACRAGAPIVAGCCDLSELTKHAWYKENSGGRYHPVATRLPNAWGLYDMQGNVWEWCGDWFAPYPNPSSDGPIVDPLGPPTGKHRVRRGGSWNRRAEGCRPTHRYYGDPDIRYPIRLKAEEPRPERKNGARRIRYLIQGFRVCLPYDPPAAGEADS